MKHKIVILTLLVLMALATIPVQASNVSVATTVVNSNYLDVTIWILLFIIGLACMFLSHIPGWDKSNPIWACLAPFFTFATAWFSTSLQYTSTLLLSDDSVVLEHFIYHLDWMATGLLGIVFIFSCLNVAYVLSGRSVQKSSRDEIYTKNAKQESISDE